MSEREKTYVEDVNRSIYDIRNEEKDVYRIKKGLTPDIVAEISEKKKDPAWMANFRLQSLQIYNEMEVPDWGPSIEGLNMEDIVTYVKPNTHMSAKWSEVPEDIKDTFEKLGIPQAERKSISKDGGISTFRSSVVVKNSATKSKSAVSCQSLMLDDKSRSDTIPAMDIRTQDADIGHEAKIGRISDEAVFYLMSRGISEEDARAMIVSGFADNVSKELPLEYAVEMNNLIRLEMKGSIG